jgi:hypothetical protein
MAVEDGDDRCEPIGGERLAKRGVVSVAQAA